MINLVTVITAIFGAILVVAYWLDIYSFSELFASKRIGKVFATVTLGVAFGGYVGLHFDEILQIVSAIVISGIILFLIYEATMEERRRFEKQIRDNLKISA